MMITDADKRWSRRHQAYLKRKCLREMAVKYKGGRCEICKYVGLPSIYDFHHEDPREKEFAISRKIANFESIRRELDKCHLLCCRCHREVHEGMHPRYLIRPETDFGYDWDLEAEEGDLSYEEGLGIEQALDQVAGQPQLFS